MAISGTHGKGAACRADSYCPYTLPPFTEPQTLNPASFPFPRIIFAILVVMAFTSAQYAPAAQSTPSTNMAPPTLSTLLPALTNALPELPPITTNTIPAILPPKQPYVPGGSTIRSSFSGKFVVPGRTLKLPDPETGSAEPDPEAWNRAITFAMNVTDGNSDTLRYGLGLDAAKTRPQDTTRVRARSVYGESEGQKNAENAAAMVRYDRQLNRRFYALGDVDWMTDTIADIDYRLIGILSPGLHLLKSERTVCKLELGAGYLAEKKGAERDAFAAGRAAGILERLFNEHVLGWVSVEYLPKLADTSIFYLNTEAGLISMLTRDLYLNLTVEDRYDSTPAIDKKSNDLIFTTAVSLRF